MKTIILNVILNDTIKCDTIITIKRDNIKCDNIKCACGFYINVIQLTFTYTNIHGWNTEIILSQLNMMLNIFHI